MEEFNDTINLGESVVKVLKGIYDPEIPRHLRIRINLRCND